jgi:succinate-semialdehyde dehydrogenase/glutarate-semialdehyde dehydrogenase
MKLNDPQLLREDCLINGRWIPAKAGERIDVTDPATGNTVASVPKLGEGEVLDAIAGAEEAYRTWRTTLASERAGILRRWYELMLANADDLAMIMTMEQGKPLQESRGEITYAASFVGWFAEEATRVYGDVIPTHAADKRVVVIKEPVGVCAAITPWNFPAAMITRKVAPALAAGCSIIVKPASQTPLTAMALGVLAERAGVPAGVLNIVTGSAALIGGLLTSDPRVRKLSFTGSTEIGAQLMSQCGPTVKRVSLELGGNAPFIVFDDADLDAAVEGAIVSKYRNAGQTCVCANRLYAQAGIYDDFVQALARRVERLVVGSGIEPGAEIGPLIDEAAACKVEAHIEDALSGGAKVVFGGKRHTRGGTFFVPTVLSDVNDTMAVAREETFGPVAPVFRFETEQEVIARANATEFGLAAYFYSRDLARVWRVSESLEYGMVGINTGLISTATAPFGGMKASGIGREGSKYGIDEYLEIKYLCMGGMQS